MDVKTTQRRVFSYFFMVNKLPGKTGKYSLISMYCKNTPYFIAKDMHLSMSKNLNISCCNYSCDKYRVIVINGLIHDQDFVSTFLQVNIKTKLQPITFSSPKARFQKQPAARVLNKNIPGSNRSPCCLTVPIALQFLHPLQ
jgi:hypothetical protein